VCNGAAGALAQFLRWIFPIYKKSSIDLALRDAFRKMRGFLMTTKGLSEDEAISLISVGVDFGVTQVVDGNWGIHAILKKNLFAGSVTA
jgi:acetamidase/formamidase